jgi:hypothetical protein
MNEQMLVSITPHRAPSNSEQPPKEQADDAEMQVH